jgi:hypothetical protein
MRSRRDQAAGVRRRLALSCLVAACAYMLAAPAVAGGQSDPDRGATATGGSSPSGAASDPGAARPPAQDPAALPGAAPDEGGTPKDTAGDPFPGLGGESPSCKTATGQARVNCRESGSIAHRYPIGNYGFDIHIDTGFDAPSGSFFSAIQNVLLFCWLALLYLVKGVLLLLDWAFSLNLINDNMSDLRRGLTQVDELFGGNSTFFLAAIACLGLWGIWRGFVQRQTIQTIAGLAASVGLMIAALVIIHNPVDTVGHASALANGGARQVTATMADAGEDRGESDGLSAGMEGVFAAIALRPWCALQFGSIDFCLRKPPQDADLYDADAAEFKDDARSAPTVADLFLKFPANGGERGDLYENWKGDGKSTAPHMSMMKRGSTAARVALFAVIAVGVFGAIVLLAWLGFKLVGYAILALFLILLTPVMLIAAAFGENGRHAFAGWGKRLLVALIAQFLFAVLLGLVLFSAALLAGLNGIGWFGLWLIQTIFWWTAFFKRDEIVGWLTLAGRAGGGRSGLSSLLLARQLAAAPARRAAEVAGVGARRVGREGATWRHARREGEQAAARTVLGRHADRALDREYAHARAQLGDRRRMRGELRAIDEQLQAPDLDAGGRARLLTRRDALTVQLESPEWRHAERLTRRAEDNERELGQRWTHDDRERWQTRRRNELAGELPVDDPRNLLAAGIDPGEYARADIGRRAELREQAQQAIASQQRLLAGVGAERTAAPARGDARAARSEIRVSDRVHHTVREHRVLARDAARRRARERMYRPWR